MNTAQKTLDAFRTTLSIVIPAFNEEKYLAKCLESIQNNADKNFLEIIVIDNASTDSTAHIAESFANVRVVKEEKKGLTYARARGLQEAKGTYIAYLDADTKITQHWIKRAQDTFNADPKLVALSGPYDYDDLPRWKRECVWLYWLLALPLSWITGYIIVGGNFIARKDALIAIGGFDTSISFYGEDTNIARRLHAVGKVQFDRRFFVYSSARRFAKEGLLRTAWTYVLNYFSEVIIKKAVTTEYTDIR